MYSLRRNLPRLVLLALISIFAGFLVASAPSSSAPPGVKNIIVMIADGCGYNHIHAASLYRYGRTDRQVYERFPVRYGMSTYSVSGSYDPSKAWASFDYVRSGATDSAAAATAMATGDKTYEGAIGVDKNGQPLKTVLERAEELGKATGVITSVPISHATPASFVAHNPRRDSYEEIAQEMILRSATDCIMGAGHPWFDNDGRRKETPVSYQYVGGQATWDALMAGTAGADADRDGTPDPWKLIQSRSEFRSLMEGPAPRRVIGLAQAHSTLQQGRSGDAGADPFVVPLNESVPTLAEMAQGALNVLDDDPDGLFLMIEGGAVDWAAHSNQSGRMIEEEIDFNQAVEAVVKWVKKKSNWRETLLIVTGDHETGYLTGPGSNPQWKPLTNNGKGKMPGMEWHSGGHTNSLIPYYADGNAARLFQSYATLRDPVRGRYLDNTSIAKVIFEVLR